VLVPPSDDIFLLLDHIESFEDIRDIIYSSFRNLEARCSCIKFDSAFGSVGEKSDKSFGQQVQGAFNSAIYRFSLSRTFRSYTKLGI